MRFSKPPSVRCRATAVPSSRPLGTSWSPHSTGPTHRTGTCPRNATSAPQRLSKSSLGTPAAMDGVVETTRQGPSFDVVSNAMHWSDVRSVTTEPGGGSGASRSSKSWCHKNHSA